MIPNMSDQLDNELRHRPKMGSYDQEDGSLYSNVGMVNDSLQGLFSPQLFNGVNPNLFQGGEGPHVDRHELLMAQVREAAEQAKVTFVAHMESQLKEVRPVSEETEKFTRRNSQEEKEDVEDLGEKAEADKKSGRQFMPRKSLLTELVQNPNIQTVNNIFVAILFVIILNSALMHLLRLKNVGVTFELAFWTIGKVPFCLYIWCQMMLWATAVFFGTLSFWAHHPDPLCGPWKVPNSVWLVFYILGVVGFVVYVPMAVVYHDLPILTSLVVLAEQMRILMKMHAFLRVIVTRAFKWKQKINDEKNSNGNHEVSHAPPPKVMAEEEAPCPDFSLYLYYLFAPTLIYQDKYPMTDRVRWKFVRQNVLQCFVSGCYIFLIVEKMIQPVTENFARDSYSLRDVIRTCFTCMIPACLCLFLGFYTVLHCWLNAAAEMMRFADRQFYKDWWNAASFAGYYRDWNIVVHCWLYNYVYKDLRAIGLGPKQSLVFVFLLSAFAHEAIIGFSLRFCFPVLFILFGFFGVIFLFIPNRGSTSLRGTMLWLVLFIGSGILLCLYSFEWQSRKNCPADYEWYVDIFIPRSFFCSRFHFFQ